MFHCPGCKKAFTLDTSYIDSGSATLSLRHTCSGCKTFLSISRLSIELDNSVKVYEMKVIVEDKASVSYDS